MAAQRAVDVDRSAGDDVGARSDRAEHGDVALDEDNRLPRAHRTFNEQRRRLFRVGAGAMGFRALERLRGTVATQNRRQARVRDSRVDAADAKNPDIALRQIVDQMRNRGRAKRTCERSSATGWPAKKPLERVRLASRSASHSTIGGCGVMANAVYARSGTSTTTAGNEARHREASLSWIGLTLIVLHRLQNDPPFSSLLSAVPRCFAYPTTRLAELPTTRATKISEMR